MHFPCFGQPKLDGIRCTAIKKGNDVSLWTRTRKRIRSMPHIEAAILAAFPYWDTTLDGELYNHDYRDDFENIVELVRPDAPVAGHEVVQYHIYDAVLLGDFETRNVWMEDNIPNNLQSNLPNNPLVRVETFIIESADDVLMWHDKMVELGYEGLILRNAAGLYVFKRSYDLLKFKHFDTNEFQIIGIEEGRGRLQGHVGKFVCLTKNNLEFRAKQKGSLKKLKDYFEDHSLWEGKVLTVQFQNWTQDKRPRFPVGLAIRDYE
jgi:DNA ligase-1